ncbi:hypothetical protein [Flavobacterium luteum]|uniref:Uncharacterized protein n=1 Tax=Flavobacterium luteum TaxID=2026654 RepID=A0A7J5AK99_9FLAO|nr:hypothetical protein [Flavobacterium luteum]KAB1157975.1 hypothetical protein F6464_02510 [Flavobacterium luteum]
MEKLIYTNLLLSILSVLPYFLYSIFIEAKISNLINKVQFNLNSDSRKQLITAQIIDNQIKLYKNPIQLHFCPTLQFTSKSTFVE